MDGGADIVCKICSIVLLETSWRKSAFAYISTMTNLRTLFRVSWQCEGCYMGAFCIILGFFIYLTFLCLYYVYKCAAVTRVARYLTCGMNLRMVLYTTSSP